ncbi:hypothetical protein [Enterobacter roggenkampii]|uniref:hypothetical protein n=2 Tax=Enterobacterales TaxID=91347 RepID=UPI0039C2480A
MRDWRLILREEEREQARLKAMVKKIPGNIRNEKCPCGSGRKTKNCQCELFKERV